MMFAIINDTILSPKGINRRFQEDWTKDAREDHRVLMNHKVDFGSMG